MLVFLELLSKLLKSQKNGGREKVVKNETHGWKEFDHDFLVEYGNPFLTTRRFLENCWGDHFFLLMCCQKPKSGHFAGHGLHSPVTGYSFVIGRSPAHIISCRLCSFHADCAFSGHRPVTGRIRRNPASFAIAPATGSQQIVYAWPATGLHECMQGRLPAYTNV